MLMNGEKREGSPSMKIYSPYSDEVVGEVFQSGREQVPEIIEVAQKGAEIMKKMPVKQRAEILGMAAEKLLERKDEFAVMLAKEVGKVIKDARRETERAANTLRESAIAAGKIKGEIVALEGSEEMNRLGFYQRVPVGIVLAITPFNFPLNLACHKIGPAFAAGNAVILKPASKTALTTMMLGELLLECGLPKEALTVVCGRGEELGKAFCEESAIRKISFTGSYETGEQICKAAGVKRVTMELGSSGAVIVTPDTDISKAAEKLCQAGFANAGQVCISVQRVYAHRSIKAQLLEEMKRYAEQMVCGDPLKPETQLGPMISKNAQQSALHKITRSIEAGAVCVAGNQTERNILYPTILTDAPENAPVIQDEMFAPVITVNAYDTLDEAIALVNGTKYGLQAGVFTEHLEDAMKCLQEIQCGGVIINDTCNYREDQMPYGGMKNSGIGREGPEFVMEEMTEIKMMILNRQMG